MKYTLALAAVVAALGLAACGSTEKQLRVSLPGVGIYDTTTTGTTVLEIDPSFYQNLDYVPALPPPTLEK